MHKYRNATLNRTNCASVDKFSERQMISISMFRGRQTGFRIKSTLTYLPRRRCPQDAGAVRAAGRTGPPLARELALLLKQ